MLQSLSKEYFWKSHDDLDVAGSVDPDSVGRIFALKTSYENFLRFFNEIRQVHDSKHYDWELVLANTAPPSLNEEPEAFFLRDHSLYKMELEKAVDILASSRSLSCDFYASSGCTFTVKYPEFRTNSRTGHSLPDLMEQWNNRFNNVTARQDKPLLSHFAAWRKTQNILRQALDSPTKADIRSGSWEIFRLMSAAADVARIAILFHGSEWGANICACRIIHVCFGLAPDAQKILTLSLLPPSEVNSECSHYPHGVSHMTFLLLAVLLIEIGITGPVKVHLTQQPPFMEEPLPTLPFEELSFTLPEETIPGGLRNPLTLSELRSHISEILGAAAKYDIGFKYARVIESCFEMRDMLLHRPYTHLRAQDLERCARKVAKP